ncbi:hypothetical protein SAMN04489710_10368 [Paracidovorax konjaci]|uniref:Uncharacterized protein n=2 Tax=Paracidovorax konjaci TaxID=32040 RepID=A0A1I1T1U1_9BURK|nr:hypothetical protein SAMN04489710_10368 [Paracidovorax konjaci]
MDIMTIYLAFFEAHVDPLFRKDTNKTIGDTLIALAYPNLIIIGPPPQFADLIIDVNKEGLVIEPDKYPLYQFLEENPEFCESMILRHAGLREIFEEWMKK